MTTRRSFLAGLSALVASVAAAPIKLRAATARKFIGKWPPKNRTVRVFMDVEMIKDRNWLLSVSGEPSDIVAYRDIPIRVIDPI